MSRPPVYLVDASVYLFRAWFSMPDDFVNAAGQPTNAVYGFTGFLCNLLEQTASRHVAVAFDVSLESSHRNEIYPDYKANRDPAPEELKRQFAWARSVAEAMGLACYADPRYEADDLIGTLADQFGPAPPAQHEAKRIKQDGFASTGFAGQHVQTRLKRKFQPFDDQHVPDI